MNEPGLFTAGHHHRPHPWGPTLLVAVLLLAGIAYLNALDNPFVFDDDFLIVQNALLRDGAGLKSLLTRGPMTNAAFGEHYRPVSASTFWIQYQLSGLNPLPYRVVDLLLHLLNGLLSFYFLRNVLRRHYAEPQAGLGALIGVSIFLLHPIQAVTIDLLIKRTTLMSTTFTLLCLLSLVRMFERRARARVLYPCALLLGALALLSKEEAAGVPVLVGIVAVYFGVSPWRAVCYALPFFVAPIALMLFRFPHDVATQSPLGYFLAQPIAFGRYLLMLVCPDRIAVAYDLRTLSAPFPWGRAGLTLLLAAGCAALLLSCRRLPLPALCLAWALVLLGPSSSVVAMPTTMDEVRAYLSFLLLYGLVGALCAALMLRAEAVLLLRRLPRLIVFFPWLLVCIAMVTQTMKLNEMWSDGGVLFQHAVSRYPDSPLANANLCGVLFQQKALERAVVQCRKAIDINPASPWQRMVLIQSLVGLQRTEEAAHVLSAARKDLPDSRELLLMEGHLAWFQGDLKRARTAYEQVLAQDPLDDLARVYLADVYVRQQEWRRAAPLIAALEHAPPPGAGLAAMIQTLSARLRAATDTPPAPAK